MRDSAGIPNLARLFRTRVRNNNHEQSHTMADDCSQLIWLVTNPPVVRNRHPIIAANYAQPVFVRTSRRKMIAVPLDAKTSRSQDIRKTIAKIAVREENEALKPPAHRRRLARSPAH